MTSTKLTLFLATMMLMLGCGLGTPTPPAKPAPCIYEDLSTWRGAEGAWPSGMRFWLQYTTGCNGRAVAVSIASSNEKDPLQLRRSLDLWPGAYVRVRATMEILEGLGDLSLELKDLGINGFITAQPKAQGVAEIRADLRSGDAEIVLHAKPEHGSTMTAVISNVVVEYR